MKRIYLLVRSTDKFRAFIIAIIFFTLLLSGSCNKEESIVFDRITGYAQKGAFCKGAFVRLSEIDYSLQKTGKTYEFTIDNDSGAYRFESIEMTTHLAEISVTGYYYNEITGEISDSPLMLVVLTDLNDLTNVNINIFTHLESSRVKNLVAKGFDFNSAKLKAKSEILVFLGFGDEIFIEKSESLNIYADDEKNAILLASSLILQGNRSTENLAELLNNMSDMFEDGISGDEQSVYGLRKSVLNLDAVQIRRNLEDKYYQSNESFIVPEFEKYLNMFITYTGDKPAVADCRVYNIKAGSVSMAANITANSLPTSVIFEYGLTSEYGMTIHPVPEIVDGTSGMFVDIKIEGLQENTTYHFRIKATNNKGTTFSNDQKFTTLETISDIDGNKYGIVLIGSQLWMAENLKTTKNYDGTPIQNGYSWYNNDELTYKPIYGALYSFYAVESGKLCPTGWHVPSLEEWKSLISYLGGEDALGKLKEVGTLHWNSPDFDATNETNFSALPGGYRDNQDVFRYHGTRGLWWSSTKGREWDDGLLGSVYFFDVFYYFTIGNPTGYSAARFDRSTSPRSVRCLKN